MDTDRPVTAAGTRLRAGLALARREGLRALGQRGIRYAYHRYGSTVEFPLLAADVVDGVPSRSPESPARRRGEPLRIGWVCVPPAAGSGGHTTMFRMVRALEDAGHVCTLFLYDRYDGDLDRQLREIRGYWPEVRAAVRKLPAVLPAADAFVATSWDTAHALGVRHATAARRFYFVQDFEPAFYGLGAEHALAEATYRFGFHGITAGAWLAEHLKQEYGMSCDPFPFGADRDVYGVRNTERRTGVVFYNKSAVARRGHVLGLLALERFAALRPQSEIHIFGDPVGGLSFPATVHGRLTPTALDALYNRCAAGLSLSFTNVSLLPWELLASGTAPVVNDAPQNRRLLDHPGVRWAGASPGSLAAALCAAVDGEGPPPAALADQVRETTWDVSGAVVVAAFERELYAPVSQVELAC